MPSGLTGGFVVPSGDDGALGDAAAGATGAGDADGLGAGDDKGLLTAAGAAAAGVAAGSPATFENSLRHHGNQLGGERAFPLIQPQRTVRDVGWNAHQASLQKDVKCRAVWRSGDAVDRFEAGLSRGMNF